MESKIFREDREFSMRERCHIIEISNSDSDPQVSIARARVEPGTTTELHRLDGASERYLIVQGRGRAEIGGVACEVTVGDVVLIPDGVPQRIHNLSTEEDLIFYCVCVPRFTPSVYVPMEDEEK